MVNDLSKKNFENYDELPGGSIGKLVRADYLSLGRYLNPDQIARRVYEILSQLLGSDTAFVLVRWDGKRITPLVIKAHPLTDSVSLLDIVKTLQNQKTPLLLTDSHEVAEFSSLPLGYHLAYYPLTDAIDLRSALCIVSPHTIFSPALLEDLEALVVALKNALENAAEHGKVLREYSLLQMAKKTWEQVWGEIEEQQKAIERLLARNQALLDIGLAINSSLDLKDVLTTIVTEAVKLLQVSRGAIALWDEGRHDIKVMAEYLHDGISMNTPSFLEFNLNQAETMALPAENRLVELNFPNSLTEQDTEKLRRFLAESWDLRTGKVGSILISPLRWQSQTIGVIILNDQTSGRDFNKEDQDVLALIANQAAVAIENARLFDTIRDERNRTQLILNSIADAVFTTDLKQRIVTLNPGAEQISGLTTEDLIERYYWEALGMQDSKGHTLPLEASPCLQAIQNATSTEPRIFSINHPDGKRRMISLVAAPLIESGRVTGVVGVFRDVTREQEVSRLKDEFVSLVSHELRTPMASVLGFSELMLTRQVSQEKSRLYVETIHKEAQRLSNLISDFLDIQRMEAGRQVYNFSEVSLSFLVRPVLDLFNNERERIKVEFPDDLTMIRADPDRIVQTLTNLIGNAIKYSPNGGDIILRAHLNENQMVEASVQDNGLGIPKEAQSQLFNKFFRVDNSDRREIGGTGLGLAISREIIEAHGGKIWVDSALGKGSIFHFTLPAVLVNPPEPNQTITTSYSVEAIENTILIVEDNNSLAQLISTYLEEDGYSCRIVNSAEQALRLVDLLIPVAMVLDITLAGRMDGWDLLIKLKENPHLTDVPVIICTVLDTKFMGAHIGAAEFLPKPVELRRLEELINRLTALAPQRNILVIDDDASLRRMLKESLSELDFVVATAASGDQGLKLATQNPPDLIVLDLMMPKMDGFQVLSRLRADHITINIPVIVVSAKELSNDEHVFIHKGLARFLTKGEQTPQRIREAVRESLEAKKLTTTR